MKFSAFIPFFVACALALSASADSYDAPAGYYSDAIGTGSALESQLYTIMRTGQIQRRYGDFRYSAAITDADPNNPGRILLVYNRASVSGSWNSGSTWNREHVWPQSRQPGSASNSTRGNLGDPHSLRPANPSINSSRGNKPFGTTTSSGNYGAASGGYYFPGDADKGDIARQLFYSDTRYGPDLGISLKNGSSGGNQMGDLASLIIWNYADTPDDFERRRNQAIYSSSLNPSYYTNNRNAYIDHPEYVWSVFVDQNNDAQLKLAGGTTQSDGSSQVDLDFGRVIVGAAMPTSTQTVTLNKTGNDGTYYSVNTDSANVTSSVNGRFNAFEVGGSGSQSINVALQGNTLTPGTVGGNITIDNLDITTGQGSGYGGRDGNDTISANLTVLGHANASFADGSDQNSLLLDFGTLDMGSTPSVLDFELYNDDSAFGMFTAGLDLDNIVGSGDTSILTTDLSTFADLGAGLYESFQAAVDTSNAGVFSATYSLFTSDEDLAGAGIGDTLTLQLAATIIPVPEPGTAVLISLVSVTVLRRQRRAA